jgi:hypothetical protein
MPSELRLLAKHSGPLYLLPNHGQALDAFARKSFVATDPKFRRAAFTNAVTCTAPSPDFALGGRFHLENRIALTESGSSGPTR